MTQVPLVLQDCQDGQDLWVQRGSQSWVLQVLWVPPGSLVFLEQDVLGQEVHQALPDLQDQHQPMDQSQFLVHLVHLVLPGLQDTQTRLLHTRHSTL